MVTPVIIDDGQGNVFSAVAEAICSGGAMLAAGSYTSTVTARTEAQYDYSKIRVGNGGSGLNCVGMALYDVASGTTNEVAVLRRGIVILPVNGNLNAGNPCAATSTADG